MRSWLVFVSALVSVLLVAACSSSEPTWKEQWAQIKQGAVYADYCSVELCDEIEAAYEPVCDCWCDYDGGDPDDGGGDPDDGGGDPDGGGGDGDCGDDVGCESDGGEDDDGGAGCTYTQGYWKNHNETRTNRNQAIDWPAPLDEKDELCGQTLLDILNTRAGGEAWYILGHQYIAASLNVASGASTAGSSGELDEAGALLAASCGGIAAADRPRAIELAELLDAYNNGLIGPGHCD
jgi:hypothetical protein